MSKQLTATLRVKIRIPDYETDKVFTPQQIKDQLLTTGVGTNGYAIASPGKLTASMQVIEVEFDSKPCSACGHGEPILEDLP